MNIIYYVQNSLIGLAIIALIYFNLPKQIGKPQFNHLTYKAALIANALLLILEMLLNLTTGKTSDLARFGLPVIVTSFYILNPVPEALWVLYLDNIIKNGKRPTKRLTIALSLPILLNLILSFTSLVESVTFTIDGSNIYHRGQLYVLMPLICYSYLIYYLFLVVKKRKAIHKNEFWSLFMAAFPPMVAGLLQSSFYGISLVWISMSFSMLIIYIRIQSAQIYTDHLTGLGNRRKFDNHLDSLFASDRRKQKVGGILIDIDDFKKMNDIYGHDFGDRILEEVGEILRKSVRKDDFVARIGGDEFAILIEVDKHAYLEEAVQRISENLKQFNKRGDYPVSLNLSIGYELYDFKSQIKPEEFYKRLDNKMYDSKKHNKRAIAAESEHQINRL